MLRGILNPESPLMLTLTEIGDCVFLSLFFLLGCIPVVTVGTALAALYDASFRCFRQGESHSWARFWSVYKRELLPGILPGLCCIASGFGLFRGLILLWNGAAQGRWSLMLFSASVPVGLLVLGMLSVLCPMLSRFERSFGGLLKNTVILAVANLPRSLGLGLLTGLCLFLCARLVVPLFFLPALWALLGSFFIEPMFRPYLEQ